MLIRVSDEAPSPRSTCLSSNPLAVSMYTCIHDAMKWTALPNHQLQQSPAGMTAAEGVFRQILGAIISGDLPAGAIETEERLAARYQVSRTPLRDAVRRLEGLRLFKREPRGLRVPPLTMEEMHELSATREVLEGLLAASAADNVSRGQARPDRLRDIHARHMRILPLGDAELMLSIGHDFHEELRRLSGNKSAATCHEQILLGFERYRYLARGVPERHERIAEEHEEILSAIEAGRAQAAETAMRRHIAAGRSLYVEVLSTALIMKN
ncbi:GntR family transcriptional regulator [Teichococcus oryzae]|uniref:GntR family transcriptional regulator n=1 Tax=Teichococcus oryzae TaxID=1608942 RepID=A0A5B2TAQ5_9PROT|nr:GntR family transcriptional regulator [Pseudoroseomonas oryzae]KAA2211621.1 GntR family transcriptional regulator [Pseudoroseomonas oryzae]